MYVDKAFEKNLFSGLHLILSNIDNFYTKY